MQRVTNKFQEHYGSNKPPYMLSEGGSPTAHHHITAQSTDGVDLYKWINSDVRRSDPILKVHNPLHPNF